MTTLDTLLPHVGFTTVPLDRGVPPEGLRPPARFTEALHRLRFAVDRRPPALLVAPPGTGQSVLRDTRCRDLVPLEVRVVTTCSPLGLLAPLARR
jgi:hypothetical protein